MECAEANSNGWERHIRCVRRIVIAILGGSVLALGVALVVLPGPAFIVIPVGLAILATEFEWARRWLRRAKAAIRSQRMKRNNRASRRPAS